MNQPHDADIFLSVVAPCYNDRGNVAELVRRVLAVASEQHWAIEIIIVDDGSPDNAWEVIEQVSAEHPEMIGVKLSRNFGQHIAITAGIQRARGRFTAIMDGDLECLPEELPKLVAKAKEGYDFVYSLRKEHKKSWFEKLTSRSYRRMINRLSGLEIPENVTMLRVFNRNFREGYLAFSESHRTIGGLFHWMGYRNVGVEVETGTRFSGRSNFNVIKRLKRAVKNISSFSTVPIRLIGYLGLAVCAISLLALLYVFSTYLIYGRGAPGFATLAISVAFFSGMIMFSLSVIGIYIGNIYTESLKRPLYLVQDTTRDA